MNTGIQDAYNLAWKLGLVASGAAGDALLDSYSDERRPVVADVVRGSDLTTRVVTLRSHVGEQIRNHLATVLSEFEFVRRRISRGMSELRVGYRHSPIVSEDRASLARAFWPRGHGPGVVAYLDFGAAPHPGDRAPDVDLHPPDHHGPRRLFEVLHGTRHTLLLFEGASRSDDAQGRIEALSNLVRERYPRLIDVYLVVPTDTTLEALPTGVTPLSDTAGLLHHRFGAMTDCLYLVRPDGYVGYRAQPADPDKLAAYLRHLFR